MSRVKVSSVRVEYQPDLAKPRNPVPLGVLAVANLPDGRIAAWAFVGREPNPNYFPTVLSDVGPLGRSQLVGWWSRMAQDIQDAVREDKDVLEHLASRWHWNLYVGDAEEVAPRAQDTIIALAQRLYEKYVGTLSIPAIPFAQRRPFRAAAKRRWESAEAGVALPSSRVAVREKEVAPVAS